MSRTYAAEQARRIANAPPPWIHQVQAPQAARAHMAHGPPARGIVPADPSPAPTQGRRHAPSASRPAGAPSRVRTAGLGTAPGSFAPGPRSPYGTSHDTDTTAFREAIGITACPRKRTVRFPKGHRESDRLSVERMRFYSSEPVAKPHAARHLQSAHVQDALVPVGAPPPPPTARARPITRPDQTDHMHELLSHAPGKASAPSPAKSRSDKFMNLMASSGVATALMPTPASVAPPQPRAQRKTRGGPTTAQFESSKKQEWARKDKAHESFIAKGSTAGRRHFRDLQGDPSIANEGYKPEYTTVARSTFTGAKDGGPAAREPKPRAKRFIPARGVHQPTWIY